MLNHELANLALRARVASVIVATTGSTTLSATATGYARTTGSFLADGFAVGMEVTPTGFTQTTVGVVTKVEALALTIQGGRQAEAAGAGRTIATKLPALREWENVTLKPLVGRPYVEADYVPASPRLLSVPAASGTVEETGLYVVRWYGLANAGLQDLTRAASALLALFPPGGSLALSDGSALRWGQNPGPWRGPSRLLGEVPSWSLVVITIPWRLFTTN